MIRVEVQAACPKLAAHDEARTAIFEWIEVWYQRMRIHGSLGYVSREAFAATARVGIVVGAHDWWASPVVAKRVVTVF